MSQQALNGLQNCTAVTGVAVKAAKLENVRSLPTHTVVKRPLFHEPQTTTVAQA